MKVLVNKKLKSVTEEFLQLTQLADLPSMPQTPEEAVVLINSSPTPEIRQARKVLLLGTVYGAGPQQLITILRRQNEKTESQ